MFLLWLGYVLTGDVLVVVLKRFVSITQLAFSVVGRAIDEWESSFVVGCPATVMNFTTVHQYWMYRGRGLLITHQLPPATDSFPTLLHNYNYHPRFYPVNPWFLWVSVLSFSLLDSAVSVAHHNYSAGSQTD